MKRPKRLKSQIIIYFTTIIMGSSIFISWFSYYNSGKNLEENMIGNATGTIDYIMDNIDKQLKQTEQLADWVFINSSLEKLLIRDYSIQPKQLDMDMWTFQEMVSNQMINFSVWKYVTCVMVEGNNGIDLRWGQDAAYIDKEKIQEYEWYRKQMEADGKIYWYGIVKNVSTYTDEKNFLPIVRPIVRSSQNTRIGWSMIGFKESLISDVFKKFSTDTTKSLYVIDHKGVCVSNEDKGMIGRDLSSDSRIQEVLAKGDGHFSIEKGGEKSLLVFHKSQLTGWIIVQELAYSYLDNQKTMLLRITLSIFLAVLLVSSASTIFLSHRITMPVRTLHKRLKKIAEGHFEQDRAVEGEDELGMLGKGINQMAADIQKLLEEHRKEESEKRRLEISMLQSQINPHFLYNTLNTIKWIAIIQKADGVRDAVSALGRLLRNTICDAEEKITIRDEMAILDDYMYIQNLRYNGGIDVTYRVEDETIVEYNILKLTLQPIVENAIFHGIEPKKSAGAIRIHIFYEKENIVICVEDDGVGMSREKINEVMNGRKKEEKLRGLSGVGIKNVDERIKLNYGRDYGIRIVSELGEYTKVHVTIPRERQQEAWEKEDRTSC